MRILNTVLLAMLASLAIYTLGVGQQHGWDLMPLFFGEIFNKTWQGQFNFDFLCFLVLSALWTAWRNQFTAKAFALALLALVGGTMFLAPYLLILSIKTRGNMKHMLLGRNNDF